MAELYKLEELVEEWNTRSPTDVITAGTVHHYRDELMMDGPERVGKVHYYRELHINQIKVIRLMRQNGFGPEQISTLMWNLDDDKISAVIQEQENIRVLREKALKRPGEAFLRPPGSAEAGDNQSVVEQSDFSARLPVEAIVPSISLSSVKWDKHAWLKVKVTPEVEVFIRADSASRHKRELERWLAAGSII